MVSWAGRDEDAALLATKAAGAASTGNGAVGLPAAALRRVALGLLGGAFGTAAAFRRFAACSAAACCGLRGRRSSGGGLLLA